MTGAELRQARHAAGLSRRVLAALAGLHPDAVRYWERKPRLDLCGYAVVAMLTALGLDDLSRRNLHASNRFTASRHGESLGATNARDGLLPRRGISSVHNRCGARTRKGTPCRAKALPGKTRCKFHGGASTGPRTAEGRARIAEAQRKRWAAWRAAKGR